MASAREQVESFYQFATTQLANGGSGRSIDELYDQWRFESVTPEEFTENVAAIGDVNRGETGRDAQEIVDEMRRELTGPDGK